jgi:hypothetical protein
MGSIHHRPRSFRSFLFTGLAFRIDGFLHQQSSLATDTGRLQRAERASYDSLGAGLAAGKRQCGRRLGLPPLVPRLPLQDRPSQEQKEKCRGS